MTLETANRLVQEHGELACKEALAVVRGGMTICENNLDGSRKYLWLKVKPTKTDDESSIDLALKSNRQIRFKPSKVIEDKSDSQHEILQEPDSLSTQRTEERSVSSLIERLKRKAVEIWQEIDSIIVE